MVRYITPSTTTGVDSWPRSVSMSAYQARPRLVHVGVVDLVERAEALLVIGARPALSQEPGSLSALSRRSALTAAAPSALRRAAASAARGACSPQARHESAACRDAKRQQADVRMIFLPRAAGAAFVGRDANGRPRLHGNDLSCPQGRDQRPRGQTGFVGRAERV